MAEGGGKEQATGARTGTHEVFVSYASQDAAIADSVVTAFERQGLACWIAPRNVTPGAFYGDEIVHAIDAAKAIVLILSKNAADSQHVLREVERAASKRHPVVSLRIDQSALPAGLEYFLNTSQWLDASGGDIARSMPKLIAAVRVAIQAPVVTRGTAPTPRVPVPSPSARSPRRTAIIVVSLIGLAIAGFAVDRLWVSSQRGAPTSVPPAVVPVPAPAPAIPTIPEKSVAVLPFIDMSEKKDQEYFSDGMAEEIIDLLVKVPELQVPARTSSFYFKGKSTKIQEIAKELGVANVLEGSVRKFGNHLRVTVQLVRAESGFHLWSKTYDRQLEDVFTVQDEIADSVVKALRVSLLKDETPVAQPTSNSEAYDLYLRARQLLRQGTNSDARDAYAHLKRATTFDPGFAQAWAELANLLADDSVDWTPVFAPNAARTIDHPDLTKYASVWMQARAAAHEAADRAVVLGPNLGEAHAAKANVLASLDWRWTAAEAEYAKARELDPTNAGILRGSAQVSISLGRLLEGLELANRGVSLDPLSGRGWVLVSDAHFALKNYSEAERAVRRSIELQETERRHYGLANIVLTEGRAQQALDEYLRDGGANWRDTGAPLALDALGRRAEADQRLSAAETQWGNGMAYQIAIVYAARKDLDRAFYWLERAYKQRDGGLQEIKVDPMLRDVRPDPRYTALLREMNLPI